LGLANVKSLSQSPSADETRLLGNETQMLLRADPLRFADSEQALVKLWASVLLGKIPRGLGMQIVAGILVRTLNKCNFLGA
jgi:hypothetical protein